MSPAGYVPARTGRLPWTLSVLLALAMAAACGGGSGGGGGGSTTTSPPPAAPANPCTAALAADEGADALVGMVVGGERQPVTNKKSLVDGDPRGRALEAMFIHQAAGRARATPGPQSAASEDGRTTRSGSVAVDVGDVAVIEDQADLVLPANTFDLRSTGLRFTREGAGYRVSRIDATFRSSLGTRVTLADDDSSEVDVPFGFPFYGATERVAFVNSDGNITFGEEDKASTERSVARLLTGPPRVSPFLSDLDPSVGGGRVFVNAASDQYTVTWCGVRAFDAAFATTVQATLLPDGTVEYKFGDAIGVGDAIVGLSPGRTGDFTASDLSVPNPPSGSGAIAERFASASTLDTIAAAKKFYATHGDSFDQILLWTDQRLTRGGTFAYEDTVANEVRGIGESIYDLSREFGSAGRLRSMVVMDYVAKYPDDPTQKFLGENNTLSVLGQEVGHRWLAYMGFRDRTGRRSDALLGRDLAHWSFFFNSEASVMEGNEIQDLGGGQFKTVDAVKRFSRLDQYAMGLIPPGGVPTMFYVESPSSGQLPDDAPKIGVSFTGTRRDLLIDDIVAVNGPRLPAAQDSPKTHRQAFVYIVSNGRTMDPAQVAKVDSIRRAWEGFFLQATENRMTANTRLR
jgi:hypothetical protein